MSGETSRDWKNVEWHWSMSGFGKQVIVSATVNGTEIRSYEFDTGIPPTAARLINDFLTALRQHRGQA